MRQLLFGLVLGLAGCLAQQPPETSVVAGNLSEVPALAQAAAPAGGPGGSSPSATAGPSGSSSSSSALTPSEPHETAASSGVANSEQPACVHVEKEHCPPAGELCRCKVIDGTASVLCCDITSQLQLKESLNCQGIGIDVLNDKFLPVLFNFDCFNLRTIENSLPCVNFLSLSEEANITGLHARNITLASLDVSLLNLTRLHLPHLESLAITDGHISELYGHLDAKNLACLNFSSNNLITLYGDTFSSLHSLENLDLSGNCLADVVNLNADVPEFTLDVSGNNNVSCGSIMELMKRMRNLKFSHDNDTYCLSSQSYSWFNSSEKIPLSSIAVLSKLEQECPKGETEACSCNNSGLLILPGKPPTYAVSVDCSNRRLTKLPPTLPKNTNSLNVNSNNISDLADLSMNEAYADIKMFHADDNQITSITALEGSAFINSFTHLSLRNNNISSLPTYILSNVFDRWDSITVHLGLNRLKCDCTTAQQLKMWLNANSKHIPDYKEVLCENMRERVFELDQTKVCTVQSDWTEYVYYIVVAEVLLLILLISKVSYDYWVFKTAGYLPWPASKMPKLPCDWVFES